MHKSKRVVSTQYWKWTESPQMVWFAKFSKNGYFSNRMNRLIFPPSFGEMCVHKITHLLTAPGVGSVVACGVHSVNNGPGSLLTKWLTNTVIMGRWQAISLVTNSTPIPDMPFSGTLTRNPSSTTCCTIVKGCKHVSLASSSRVTSVSIISSESTAVAGFPASWDTESGQRGESSWRPTKWMDGGAGNLQDVKLF